MRRAVFLDRDGTINRDVNYLNSIEQIEILPGVPKALRMLGDAGFLRVVVTNQSGVARGIITSQQLDDIHRAMEAMLRDQDAGVDAIYYCPHLPDGAVEQFAVDCQCRKPKPGLLLQAAEDLGIDLGHSFMIGDSPRDIEAGKRAGCRTFLITNGDQEPHTRPATGCKPDAIVDDLTTAARIIIEQ